jgi:hypothetical protein
MVQESVPSTQYSDLSRVGCWILATGCSVVLCCPQMCRVSQWTARLLMLVMLVPAYAPMAMACVARPMAMHCARKPVSGHVAPPAMPCHQAMADAKAGQSESSETSVQADGNCCQSHCCCGATTSEWARPAPGLLSVLSLLIELAPPTQSATLHSSNIFGHDSARAPPRS